MHNSANYRKLLFKSTDKDVLRWRAYAQLGAMTMVLVLMLVLALYGASEDTRDAAPAQAAVQPVRARIGNAPNPPAHAETAKGRPAGVGTGLPVVAQH
jgi:hypothetical protein